ncbi:MAG TPA: acylphosphatase [Cytophagales bacterium]|nr:acylphosphatase [Cytophagales bacterium]HCR54510.1 acylphosphatase [Cytophagales bacterium]
MKKAYQLNIKGRVQGVFYRASMRNMASELGIMGYVCNQMDGSVYAEIEGSEDKLNQLIAWCKVGPSGAKVEEVNILPQSEKGYKSFEIRRF